MESSAIYGVATVGRRETLSNWTRGGREMRGRNLICPFGCPRDGFTNTWEQRRQTYKEWLQASKVEGYCRNDGSRYSDAVMQFGRTMLGGVTFEGTENAEQSDWYVFEMKAMA
jgi:hypothetical protein